MGTMVGFWSNGTGGNGKTRVRSAAPRTCLPLLGLAFAASVGWAQAAGLERLNPEVFEVETAGALEIMDVSYSAVTALCADGDGCKLRMVLSEGGSGHDSRLFLVGNTGGWRANTDGGGLVSTGSASNTTDEIVFSIGSDAMCHLRDATTFNGMLLLRKFQVWVEGPSIIPGPASCVLRIED